MLSIKVSARLKIYQTSDDQSEVLKGNNVASSVAVSREAIGAMTQPAMPFHVVLRDCTSVHCFDPQTQSNLTDLPRKSLLPSGC